jgi:predicted CXXCH cytochrome family protein
MHQMHVTDHKVDCLECHLEIQHSLDRNRIEHAAADCTSCHSNQHGEQVRMLLGQGGKSISARHGGMAVAGISCPSCHQVKEISPTGTVLWRASTAICTQCHDQAATERLAAHHELLKSSLADIESDLSRAREALGTADLDATRMAEITQRLHDLEDDLQFLCVGNSIHNMHYADSLTRALVDKLRAVCSDLGIDEPMVNLPSGNGLVE